MSSTSFRKLRHLTIPRYVDDVLLSIPWQTYDVVGFTSTFQQTAASLAVASRIKDRFPRTITLFGGANFEGEMGIELVRTNESIDFALIGEAEDALPEFLTALSAGADPGEISGIASRQGSAVRYHPREGPFNRMDELPTPCYEEYFVRAESTGLLSPSGRRNVLIPFESARGCWWGAKSHCTFCGLNGSTMAFRSKSSSRVLEELAIQASRYRSFQFEAVDNILPLEYINGLFSDLERSGIDYEFFYEVKANLTRAQIKSLRRGGVRHIQPGIESLNSRVLKLMRKGCSAIQNVNLLRWALYYDIKVSWNIIWGFPGELAADYSAQPILLRNLIHLQPPDGAGRIWLERFSPLFAEHRSRPESRVAPEASYKYVYPKEYNITSIAYFFDYCFDNGLNDEVYQPMIMGVEAWQRGWAATPRPSLIYRSAPGFLQIDDSRHAESTGVHTFRGPLAQLYHFCSERPVSSAQVKRELLRDFSESEIRDALNEFCDMGLMMTDDGTYLSLAVPAVAGR